MFEQWKKQRADKILYEITKRNEEKSDKERAMTMEREQKQKDAEQSFIHW